jgi:hypothetical protein
MRACYRVSQKLNRAIAATGQQLQHRQHNRLLEVSEKEMQVSQLTSLQASRIDGDWKQSPCANLQSEAAPGLHPSKPLGKYPSNIHPGILQSCSGPTCLAVEWVATLDASTSLSAITTLRELQHLCLDWLMISSSTEGELENPSSILLQLTDSSNFYICPASGNLLCCHRPTKVTGTVIHSFG